MSEPVFKCVECALFCDAAGLPVPVTNAARSIELLQLELDGQTPPITCTLCREGEHRAAAQLKAAQPSVEIPHETGWQQLPPGDRE